MGFINSDSMQLHVLFTVKSAFTPNSCSDESDARARASHT